ncbi:AbgT family transporter [Microvenator marinus]|uniref:AbgT family transporter n=1 Tax=Microvenator marinus TaxID=2600177 RepID=A0A5B8XMB3_9DELT|nr:AbgT family transporter [Microvenator marinus]QED26311.1 AbgT family transporter [Microvenator marinus]
MSSKAPSQNIVVRALERLGDFGNKLPDPLTLFVIFTGLVVLASMVFQGLSADMVQRTGEVKTMTVVSLLSAEGIKWMFLNVVDNFVGFAPLGPVLTVMIGIGIAEKTGFFAMGLRLLVSSVPASLITATLVFASVMSSMTADAGYIVLTPLGALLFAGMGRHPLAGLAAAYAGVSGGYSANLLITGLDPMLAKLTQQAAQTIDPSYSVNATCNYYFMVVSTVLITVIGTVITTRIVEPMLGEWERPKSLDMNTDEPDDEHKRAFKLASGVALLVAGALSLLALIPSSPLRQPVAEGMPAIEAYAPFFDSIEILITILFIFPAIVYGYLTRQIRNDKDVAAMAGEAMGTMGAYIVLAFVAGQFVAYFNWTNLGSVTAVKGAEFLRDIGLTGLPLLLGFLVVSSLMNMLVGSASAKWAFMAPIFIPMLMQAGMAGNGSGFSPELVQATYRVGDSVTNIITPLMPYLPIIIVFAQRYDPKAGMGTILAAMVPYSIALGIGWTIMIFIWYTLGLPLGPGAPIFYPAP